MMTLPIERLDRSRPYGSVHGEETRNVAFMQRSKGLEEWPYNAQGELIEALLTKEQQASLSGLREKATKTPTPAPAAAPVASEDFVEPDAVATPAQSEDDDVNLEMWLRGQTKYKEFQIRNAVKRRYKVNKPDLSEIARFLVEDAKPKLMARREVHPSILPALAAEDAA